MPVEAEAITELLRVWQLCTPSQNICFCWETCRLFAVDFLDMCVCVCVFYLSNQKGLRKINGGKRVPGIVTVWKEVVRWPQNQDSGCF